jgi:hypothetical protein
MNPPFTKSERDTVLVRYRALAALYNSTIDAHVEALGMPGEIGIDEESSAFVDSADYREARRAYAELSVIEAEYFRRVPRLPMAPCPQCGRVLYRSFDPFGLDGLWWRSDAQPEEPAACPHFCVLLGAVSLGEHRPSPGFEVHPGPGAPFVMPRLMGLEGMSAVLAEIPLVDGAVAYPVAYFAARRPPVQRLTASWARTNFVYTTQLGEHGWRASEEPTEADPVWDFELRPWLTGGRLSWCEPGSDRTMLGARPPAECPFLDHPGLRRSQVVR